MRLLIAMLAILLTSGCASIAIPGDKVCQSNFLECVEEPKQVELPTYRKLRYLPPAETMPVVAVYKFDDLTGQRLSSDGAVVLAPLIPRCKKFINRCSKAAGPREIKRNLV